ncbi:LLM class flavin-dependent oxidoreductase [Bacillus sp. B15-48]|uniref:LLM class flavin-dependent oxidoreductase n=1 Tax=Bacillus sp. B15-48 TaxID=1548601 RepID=UPI00193FA7E4|nr:LLM class flavin-dependent oxidoreductase [Bacillus sp. B15-48]MBM4763726.1 LLM class flavin-dependent oxidoreductase [Bacillus sp. B15-48]
MEFSLFTVFDNYKNQKESFTRTPEQLLQEVLEQTVVADELGYKAAWFAEHHFSEYGIMTTPQTFLAVAAERTKNIRLGTAIVTLPFKNPIQVAEDYALLDVLSGGRINLGLGSGYLPHEFAGFNVDGKDKALRFNDSLAVIKKAWTGEKFSHDGDYYQYKDIKLEVTPKQKEMPIWIGTLSHNGAQHVGEMGYNISGVPYVACNSVPQLKDIIDNYKKTYREAGHDESKIHTPLALHAYVAETREEAIEIAKPHLDLYLDTRMYGKSAKYEDLRDRGQVLIGSPQDVIEMLKEYEDAGCDEVMLLMNYGGLPHEKVVQSMELVAKKVMPAFKKEAVLG